MTREANADKPLPTKNLFLVPAPGKLVIEMDDFKYSGKLIIPDNAKEQPSTGVIRAMGTGSPQRVMGIAADQTTQYEDVYEIGDRIVFPQFSGTLVMFKNAPKYRVLGYEEILAIVAGEQELEGTSA